MLRLCVHSAYISGAPNALQLLNNNENNQQRSIWALGGLVKDK